jgi:hypothetical protein
MFSKPIQFLHSDDILRIEVKPKPSFMTYTEYLKNREQLHRCKINELKDILKAYHLRLGGTKPELILRIENHFIECCAAEKIQRVFRGYIGKQSILLRGEGFKDITVCVNDNDFYSLEPLKEIGRPYFFSFNSGKFTYGCNIISLILLIREKTVVKNPYNRENIPLETIRHILNLYQFIRIIYGLSEDMPIVNTESLFSIHKNINQKKAIIPSVSLITNTLILDGIDNEIIMDRQTKLRTMRENPFLTRVQELFIEIDQLGNYTSSEWFLQLERYDYVRMYRLLHEIWTFRGNLSRETKKRICVVEDPFFEALRERIQLHNVSLEVIRETCLKIFENLVYCGIDDEHRKIGALHALSALTLVSYSARDSLRWLYESLY